MEEYFKQTTELMFGNREKKVKSMEKDIGEWAKDFIKYVARHKRSCSNTFKRFIDFLCLWSRINFGHMKKVIFDDCNIIMYLTPMILDSDNIKTGEAAAKNEEDEREKEKPEIIRPLMLYLDTCTCEPDENIQSGKITS